MPIRRCGPGFVNVDGFCRDCSEPDFLHEDCQDYSEITFVDSSIVSNNLQLVLKIDDPLPASFLDIGQAFLIHVLPKRVRNTDGVLESLEFDSITMAIEGTGEDAFTKVTMTRLGSSSKDPLSTISEHYRHTTARGRTMSSR